MVSNHTNSIAIESEIRHQRMSPAHGQCKYTIIYKFPTSFFAKKAVSLTRNRFQHYFTKKKRQNDSNFISLIH